MPPDSVSSSLGGPSEEPQFPPSGHRNRTDCIAHVHELNEWLKLVVATSIMMTSFCFHDETLYTRLLKAATEPSVLRSVLVLAIDILSILLLEPVNCNLFIMARDPEQGRRDASSTLQKSNQLLLSKGFRTRCWLGGFWEDVM